MRAEHPQPNAAKRSTHVSVERRCIDHYWISLRHFSKLEPDVNVKSISWTIGINVLGGKRRVEWVTTCSL